MRGHPTGPWGKFTGPDKGGPAWHPLADHCADVAACCEALLRLPLINRRLCRIGGLDDLSEVAIMRLSAIAFLHDIGKANHGFQDKGQPGSKSRDGHIRELAPLCHSDSLRPAFLAALPFEAMDQWFDGGGFWALLVAAISHHGSPWNPGEPYHCNGLWQPAGDCDPMGVLADLGRRLRLWFPAAFAPDIPPMAATAALQHAFAGLVMLADWLGSDERFFPYAKAINDDRMALARHRAPRLLRDIGLDVTAKRAALVARNPLFRPTFGDKFDPNAMQQAVADVALAPLVIVESETGSGKTEAAIWHFKRLFEAGLVDGLYFALPTRVAATQIHDRVSKAVKALFPAADKPAVVLAVPGYVKVDDVEAEKLPHFRVQWHDEPADLEAHKRWAAESPKRFLAAQVAVGTIDQVLLSNLTIRHAHLRSSTLLRHLLVVDEVHASDAYMTALLQSVLDIHLKAGGHALLMSATLGAGARVKYLSGRRANPPPIDEAMAAPYPCLHWQGDEGPRRQPITSDEPDKKVRVVRAAMIDEPGSIAAEAIAAARRGAKVLVIRNTVPEAVATQQAVEALCESGADRALLLQCAAVATLHHGRFARDDRALIDGAVEKRLGKSSPRGGAVVVGTQTLEQSLDIDADLLITDLCPMDVLLQRIGRLHRHAPNARPNGFHEPRCIVLTAEQRDLSPLLDRARHGLGKYVYDDLRVIEATLRLLEAHAVLAIPGMNRELVERATHPQVLDRIAAEMGPAWQAHGQKVLGTDSAHRNAAAMNRIDRNKPFGEIAFPSSVDEKIRTRLGEDDRLVAWPESVEPPLGPFGKPVRRLILRHFLCRDLAPDAEPTLTERRSNGFTFSLGNKTFNYDRLGLRLIKEGP